MEEIIYLESDEEITTVIDKIKQAKSSHLVLVVPRDATLLQSVVNLKLLLKEAKNLTKDIALVTADKIGRNLASQVGLVVFDSIKDRRPIFQPAVPTAKSDEIIEIDMRQESQKQPPSPKGVSVHHFQEDKRISQSRQPGLATPWSKKTVIKKEIHWSRVSKVLWPMFTVVVILLLIGAFLILPKVTVTCKVKAENFQKTEDIKISGQEESNITNKTFKGSFIELNKEKEEKFPATGKKNLGGKAIGTLTLYNYWDSSPQDFPSGTKFSSSSKTFLSKDEVTIPGTSIRGGNPVPGTATVDIEAENPGEDYNLQAARFTIVGLSALQQEKIYGQSNRDLTGGFSKEVSVVSESDYNKAKEKISQELTDALNEEFEQKSNGSEILDKAIQNESIQIKSSAEIDSEANDFVIKINQRLRAIVFDRNLFDEFVLDVLEKQIQYDKMISLGPNDSVEPQNIETKYDEKLLNLNIEVKAKISSRVDTEKIKKDLLGKSQNQVSEYLNNLSGVSGFEIDYQPTFWLKRIPNFAKFLTVNLLYIDEENLPSPTPSTLPSLETPIVPSPTENLP